MKWPICTSIRFGYYERESRKVSPKNGWDPRGAFQDVGFIWYTITMRWATDCKVNAKHYFEYVLFLLKCFPSDVKFLEQSTIILK